VKVKLSDNCGEKKYVQGWENIVAAEGNMKVNITSS